MRLLWVTCFSAIVAWGHDAPAQVTVHLHLRPADGAMHVLARIPMEAVRDVDFPRTADGFLDVAATAPRLDGLAKLWVADPLWLLEDGVRAGAPRIVATQISKESDRSFASYEQAELHLREPLPTNGERLTWKQVFFDVALEYPVRSVGGKFAVRPFYADLGERVNVVLHYGGKTFLVDGDVDAFPLEPNWWQASWRFVRMGFVHILEGADHLLFLLCLVIPFRRFRPLIWVVTAFTVAHSITLVASAMEMAPGALWFPPLVELLIAVSIVFVALGNILGWAGHRSWMLAFGFGLVHGFGFSFALRESMQFAGTHLAAALLSFNVGVELGQLVALAAIVPLVNVFLKTVAEERTGMIVLSAVAAHVGWQWMWERGERLGKYAFAMPEWSAANGAMTLKWVLGGMILWGAIWLGRRVKE